MFIRIPTLSLKSPRWHSDSRRARSWPNGWSMCTVSKRPLITSISKTKMGHETLRYNRYNLYRITLFCNKNKKPRTDHVTLSNYNIPDSGERFTNIPLRSQVVSSKHPKLWLTHEFSFSRISESTTGYTLTPSVGSFTSPDIDTR